MGFLSAAHKHLMARSCLAVALFVRYVQASDVAETELLTQGVNVSAAAAEDVLFSWSLPSSLQTTTTTSTTPLPAPTFEIFLGNESCEYFNLQSLLFTAHSTSTPSDYSACNAGKLLMYFDPTSQRIVYLPDQGADIKMSVTC